MYAQTSPTAIESGDDALSAGALKVAFAEFEGASRVLVDAYTQLESRLVGLNDELSAARNAERDQLLEKERLAERLAALLEALPGGVVVLDGDGCIKEYNPAAAELLGPLPIGTAWKAVVAATFAPRWDDGHDMSLKDGRMVNVATQSLPREPGQILLIKDVTETRQLQDQLAHQRRISAKTEVAAALAHQVRTPLSAALLNLATLKRRGRADADAKACERTFESLRKIEHLVEDMLVFARGGQLEVDSIATSQLVAAIHAAACELPGGDVIGFESALLDTEAVNVNIEAIVSISMNLLENALDACADPRKVKVSARRNDGLLTIAFRNEGPAIGERDRQSIFEPFYSTKPNGTGLGLAVARSIARAHCGEISLRGGPLTCFELVLPLIASDRQGE
ncbi:MAG: ATP-binding protein [Pseudomonadota bacterium]